LQKILYFTLLLEHSFIFVFILLW